MCATVLMWPETTPLGWCAILAAFALAVAAPPMLGWTALRLRDRASALPHVGATLVMLLAFALHAPLFRGHLHLDSVRWALYGYPVAGGLGLAACIALTGAKSRDVRFTALVAAAALLFAASVFAAWVLMANTGADGKESLAVVSAILVVVLPLAAIAALRWAVSGTAPRNP